MGFWCYRQCHCWMSYQSHFIRKRPYRYYFDWRIYSFDIVPLIEHIVCVSYQLSLKNVEWSSSVGCEGNAHMYPIVVMRTFAFGFHFLLFDHLFYSLIQSPLCFCYSSSFSPLVSHRCRLIHSTLSFSLVWTIDRDYRPRYAIVSFSRLQLALIVCTLYLLSHMFMQLCMVSIDE